MTSLLVRMLVLLSTVPLLVGCPALFVGWPPRLSSQGVSPLAPPRMSPDSVVLDIFFVRMPLNDPRVDDRLWMEIDEQHFPPELRKSLQQNGFRVGLTGGQIPQSLCHLLKLTDQPVSRDLGAEQLAVEPTVVRRQMQLRANQPGEIITSDIYDELPVLVSESGQLSGRPYQQAQAILTAESHLEPDGRVRLTLVPALQYGQRRQRWVRSQGIVRLDAQRAKRTFDKLITTARLAPGQMLVLASLPNRPGSLGHHFLTTETSGRLEQKLLVIRLSQTQHDGAFAPGSVLPLDELLGDSPAE